MQIRIYYHHTDAGGVVYYGKYLNFLEESRTEFLEKKGVFIKELIEQDILFVVARQEIDYKFPAFYGDVLEIETVVTKVTGVRLNFESVIKNQSGRVVVLAKTILVCVDKTIHPQPIPTDILKKINPN